MIPSYHNLFVNQQSIVVDEHLGECVASTPFIEGHGSFPIIEQTLSVRRRSCEMSWLMLLTDPSRIEARLPQRVRVRQGSGRAQPIIVRDDRPRHFRERKNEWEAHRGGTVAHRGASTADHDYGVSA
jgi:hypothetical protein